MEMSNLLFVELTKCILNIYVVLQNKGILALEIYFHCFVGKLFGLKSSQLEIVFIVEATGKFGSKRKSSRRLYFWLVFKYA